MQITILGASGKVGRQVTQQALDQDYTVTALVHKHNPFQRNKGLTIIRGDIKDRSAVATALSGSQAVIVCLGSWHTKTRDIVSSGMRTVIPVMGEQRIKRIITLTGAGAVWEHDKLSSLNKASHKLLSLVAPRILRDGEEHLRLLEASTLDWTCLRSPIMTKSTKTSYVLGAKLPALWASIPRAAVVECLVDQLEDVRWLQSAPFIRRSAAD